MDPNIFIVIAHLLFFGVIALLAMATTHWRRDILEFYYNRLLFRNSISREQYHRMEQLLNKHFSYFRSLSTDGKSRFIQRATRFSNNREFVGMEGLYVSPQMRLLISASAVQLTFGLRDFNLRFLEEIRVFPGPFTFGYKRQSMKGAVSPNGFMMISWKDFMEGYNDDEDNYNLGLHEMAHALKLEVAKADAFDLRFSSYIDRWLEVGEEAFFNIRNRKQTFLRNYGGTNRHEFFAVCVEHFFESPEAFAKELPDVFNHLCKLLNQNPLNQRDDYRVTDSFKRAINSNPSRVPVPEKLQKRYPKDHFNRFHVFAMFILFFSIPFHAAVNWNTLFEPHLIVVVGIMGAAAGAYLQRKYLIQYRVLSRFFYFLYGLALVVFVGTLYLAANRLVLLDEYEIHYHRIAGVSYESLESHIRLEGNALQEFKEMRKVSSHQTPMPKVGDVAAYTFRTGALGLPVLTEVRYGTADDDGRFVESE